ncbi:MAG: DUF2189 domain-containing protein [Rugosibacter sp.]|nr:MAG: DUF2189 domain-containing protein [Rugosibacter sp.]
MAGGNHLYFEQKSEETVMSEQNASNLQTEQSIAIRRVGFLSPFHWLRQGWSDMVHSLTASLGHGLIITAMGWVVVMFTSNHLYLFSAAISGFLLVSPLMATGLYELSRRKESGQPVSFEFSLNGLKINGGRLARLAALLVPFVFVWIGLSALIFKNYFHGELPAISGAIYQTSWITSGGTTFLLTYGITGGVIAAGVFMLTAVSVPMIMDRSTGLMTAMGTSIKVVMANVPAMLLWAALLVTLTAIGFATQLWGMIVIIPLLGHATWHAYRDTVGAVQQ